MNRIIPGTNYSVDSPLGEVVPVVLPCQVTLVLDNDEIKALPNTRYTILEAPGANKIIIARFAILSLIWFDDYDDIGANSYIRLTPRGMDILDQQGNSSVTQLLQSGQSTYIFISNEHSVITDWGTTTPSGNTLIADVVNELLEIFGHNDADANFSAGHANNKLKVTVLYNIYDIETGLFQ